MKNLIEDHFQRGEIVLPGIEEKIQLPPGVLFRDEGEVKSLIKSLVRTDLIRKGEILSPQGIMDRIFSSALDALYIWTDVDDVLAKNPNLDLEHTIGYCLRHKTGNGPDTYSIAVTRGLEESKKRFAQGHESGHLIDTNKLNQRQFLQKLLNQRGIRLDSSPYQGEDFADIGGLLALKKLQESGESDISLPIFQTRERVKDVLIQPFGFEYSEQAEELAAAA